MKDAFKKIVAVLTLVLLSTGLSACGGDDEQELVSVDLNTYEGDLFTIDIDPTWEVITPSDFYEEMPDETVVGFVTPESYDGFFTNVNITREELTSERTAMEYGNSNINQAAQTLVDYEKIDERQVDLGGVPGVIHIYNSRLNPTEKLIRKIQLYTVNGKTGYIISGGMMTTTPEEERSEVGQMILSFRFK